MRFSDVTSQKKISEVDDGGVGAEEEIIADDALGASAGGPDLSITRKHDISDDNLAVHTENGELEDESIGPSASPTGNQSTISKLCSQVMRWMGLIWNALCTPYAGLVTMSAVTLVTALLKNNCVWIVGIIEVAVCLVIGTGRIMQMMAWEKDGTRITSIEQLARVENASHLAFRRVWLGLFPVYSHDCLLKVVKHKKPTERDPLEKKHLRIYGFTAASGVSSKSDADVKYMDIYVIKVTKEFPWIIHEEDPEGDNAFTANIKKGRLYLMENESYSKTAEERKRYVEFAETLQSELKGTYNMFTHNCQHFVTACLSPDKVGYSRQVGTYVQYVQENGKWKPIKLGKERSSAMRYPIPATPDPADSINKRNEVDSTPVQAEFVPQQPFDQDLMKTGRSKSLNDLSTVCPDDVIAWSE